MLHHLFLCERSQSLQISLGNAACGLPEESGQGVGGAKPLTRPRLLFAQGIANARGKLGEILQALIQQFVQAGQIYFEVAVNEEIAEAGDCAESGGESWIESIRSRHSLAGTNRLGKNPLAQLRFHRVPHDQVYASAKDFFQSPLDAKKVEEADRPVEFDEKIDVAVSVRFATCYRAEQVE